MVRGYFPKLYKDGCEKGGKDYCCSAGVKYFNIYDGKVCDNTISADNLGNSTGQLKIAAVVEYGCNQEARRRTVSLRYNGKYKTECIPFDL